MAYWKRVAPSFKCKYTSGFGEMSARDKWRYMQTLNRFKARYGEPLPLLTGEIGRIESFRFITVAKQEDSENDN